MERKFGFLCFRGRRKHNFLRIHFNVLGGHLTPIPHYQPCWITRWKKYTTSQLKTFLYLNYPVNALKLTYFLFIIYIKIYRPFFKLKMNGYFDKNKNMLKQYWNKFEFFNIINNFNRFGLLYFYCFLNFFFLIFSITNFLFSRFY